MGSLITGKDVVAAARGWIGTPYHHQASVRGVGTDCLGLVRGIWRELFGDEAEVPPAYSRDWAEAGGVESMIEAAARHLEVVDDSNFEPGCVVVFRLRPGLVAKHAAILASGDTMIHAMEGCPVAEVALSPWWRRRIASAFRFPGTADITRRLYPPPLTSARKGRGIQDTLNSLSHGESLCAASRSRVRNSWPRSR